MSGQRILEGLNDAIAIARGEKLAAREHAPYVIRSRTVMVTFEPRGDGGLRAYCRDVPGFILSHADPDLLRADVQPALEVMVNAITSVPREAAPGGGHGSEEGNP